MVTITRPTKATISYSEHDIRDLIIRDLAEKHDIVATIDDLKPVISGGGTHRAIDNSYSGGFDNSAYEIAPAVKFDGYTGVGTDVSRDSEYVAFKMSGAK